MAQELTSYRFQLVNIWNNFYLCFPPAPFFFTYLTVTIVAPKPYSRKEAS